MNRVSRSVVPLVGRSIVDVVAVAVAVHLCAGMARAQPSPGRIWTTAEGPLRFEQLSISDGLSQSTVTSIVQDSDGFVWFGTENGLNRFDGYRFTVFRHVPGDPQSLGSNHVTCLTVDRAGVLWIGTIGGGLNRFDAEREVFRSYLSDYYSPELLASNDITAIHEDRQGTLWIGTSDQGLSMLGPDRGPGADLRFTTFRHDPDDEHSVSSNQITCLYGDPQGRIWIGTEDAGVNVLQPQMRLDAAVVFDCVSSTVPVQGGAAIGSVQSLVDDRRGRLWIGTWGGLYRLDPGTGELARISLVGEQQGEGDGSIYAALHRDASGGLWVGTDGDGLVRIESTQVDELHPEINRHIARQDDPNSLSSNSVESLYEDRSGVLWVGTYKAGINKLVLHQTAGSQRVGEVFHHFHHDPFDDDSLANNMVNAIGEDHLGRLWVGMDGGGLDLLLPPRGAREPRFVHHRADPTKPTSLSDDVVTCLLADGAELWVGTYRGGLNRARLGSERDHTQPTFTRYLADPADPTSLSSNFVMSLAAAGDEVLWVGTIDGGLNRFDLRQETFISFQYSDDNPASISDDSVNTVMLDNAGALWVGTSEGLNRMTDVLGRFERWTHDPAQPTSISADWITCIFQDSSGALWIGTNGGGLNLMRDRLTGAFSRFTVEDGLANNVVWGILEDDIGDLWLSTNQGLSRFDPRSRTFTNHDLVNGPNGNELSRGAFCRTHTGELLVGSGNGLTVFHPDDLSKNLVAPPVVFTRLEILNQPVAISSEPGSILHQSITRTSSLTLSARRHRVFSLEFAALHYANPSKNQYAYMLQGFDEDWIQAGARRYVTYTSLRPGTYLFRVKGSNSDGLWNEEGATLTITITPPFWQTSWFYALVAGVLLAGAFSAYQLRVHRLKRTQHRLQALVEQRTAELATTNFELETANEELRRLAANDSLTGIANIRHFRTVLADEWRRALRGRLALSLLLIDIDSFKEFNDAYGHQAGDECLKQVATILDRTIHRAGDLAARYGGDEFVVVLSDTDREGALAVAERVRELVQELVIQLPQQSQTRQVTVSIGCATTTPSFSDEPGQLIERADRALYDSKRRGRNMVSV